MIVQDIYTWKMDHGLGYNSGTGLLNNTNININISNLKTLGK